jgi:predicted  nucleic acid-binding Zn-ribbon protein
MSEQYAFAIGFDIESMHDEIAASVEQVAAAIAAAGLPPIESERWDEFGQGRIFWGTKAECDAVHQVLSQFDLYIEEDRNLEPGYYSTANATYYVDDAGNIYALPPELQTLTPERVESAIAIPLDAYRLRSLDPALDATVQHCLQVLSTKTTPSAPECTAAPEGVQQTGEAPITSQEADYVALQAQFKQQILQIHELERQVTAFEDQIAELQRVIATKVDPQTYAALEAKLTQTTGQLDALQTQIRQLPPLTEEPKISAEDHHALQQQVAQQAAHILDLEAQLTQANANVAELQERVTQAIDPQIYRQLQQQLKSHTSQIQDLQQVIQQLEHQVQETTAAAAQKVDTAKYEALNQDLSDKSALITDLRRTIHQMERDLSEWQTVAESKVDWAEYQAIQAELQQLRAKQGKGFFGRLFGWLLR